MSTESLLPDNRTLIETALEQTLAEHLAAIPSPFPDLWNPDDVSLDLLPWLAQAKGVTRWNATAPESERRTAVRDIWPLQKEAGMRAAIRRATIAAGFEAEVVPWYRQQPAGSPYSMMVTGWAADKPLTEEQRLDLLQRVQDAVSERDEVTVRIGRQSSASPFIAAVAQLSKLVTVQPYVITELVSAAQPQMAVGLYSIKTMNIQAAI